MTGPSPDLKRARKIWLLEAVAAAETVEDLGFIIECMIRGD
ncbi:MAG: hypothetical protein ABGX63_00700 [bacterium]|jgi:hypothetical protein